MLARRKRTPAVDGSTAVLDVNKQLTHKSDFAQLAALVKVARGKLHKLAQAQTFVKQGNAVVELGDIDGANITVMVAKVDVDGDGLVSPTEFSRFQEDASELISNVQSSVLNTSIVAALLLTILVPLLVEIPYEPWDDEHDTSAFGHAAMLFTGGENAERVRRGLYVAECAVLCITIMVCVVSLFVSVGYYGSIAAMPGKLPTVRFLLETSRVLSTLQNLWSHCLIGMLLSITFSAARASGVAFIGSLVVVVCSPLLSTRTLMPTWRVTMRVFHEEAVRLVGSPAAAGAAADAGRPPAGAALLDQDSCGEGGAGGLHAHVAPAPGVAWGVRDADASVA